MPRLLLNLSIPARVLTRKQRTPQVQNFNFFFKGSSIFPTYAAGLKYRERDRNDAVSYLQNIPDILRHPKKKKSA